MTAEVTRRQVLAAAAGAAAATATGALLGKHVWPLMAVEDLIPGPAPDLTLRPGAWPTADDRVTFAAVGDTGSGGRQAMAVAGQMARTSRPPSGSSPCSATSVTTATSRIASSTSSPAPCVP